MKLLDLEKQRSRLGGRIEKALLDVLAHGKFVMGPEVAKLEEELQLYTGVRYAAACASGTDGLVMALMALGIGRGDAVVVPAFSFVATCEAVALAGATPIFADIEEDTFLLDPGCIEEAADRAKALGLKPKGVIAVDMFGVPANYRRISAAARARGLRIIADAAQSFGARYLGRPVGGLADITVTSFFPSKPLGCYGDGGAVFTNDATTAEILRSIRVHGQGADQYDNVRVGLNARLDTLQAAVLLEKISILDEELEIRREIAARYTERLARWVRVPRVPNDCLPSWAQYTIRVKGRDGLTEHLAKKGVPSNVYYRCPLHRQPAYAGFPVWRDEGLRVAEQVCGEVLSLPLHPYLTEREVEAVIEAVKSWRGARRPEMHNGE